MLHPHRRLRLWTQCRPLDTYFLLTFAMLALWAGPGCVGESDPLGTSEVASFEIGRVVLCHIPPGQPASASTIEVSWSAARAHYAHGDVPGACQRCAPGTTRSCYTGPDGTEWFGACHTGTETCSTDGSGFGSCAGEVTPTAEVCGDQIDNDCNGTSDDGCACVPNMSTPCYDGPPETYGIGACSPGVQLCDASGSSFGACIGAITPEPESCADLVDNDCDGATNEGCVCSPGATAACYSGSPDTVDVGTCLSGTETCNADGTAVGSCVGEILPAIETCGDGLDNDCDGITDDNCVCIANTQSACYAGPAGTASVGVCHPGTQTCNATGTAFGDCSGDVIPVAEVCGNGLDDNCNGSTDEGCCAPEVCGDGIDNDCDGQADEGCIGDFVWDDTDHDGSQNVTERGIPGTLLILRSAATGAVIALASTDADGTYWFSNVPPGEYVIEVMPPDGYIETSKDTGSDDASDSDFGLDSDGRVVTDELLFTGTRLSTVDCGLWSQST